MLPLGCSLWDSTITASADDKGAVDMKTSAVMVGVVAGIAAALLAAPARALTPDFPGPAVVTAQDSQPRTSFRLATGAWAAGATPVERIEGQLTTTAYRIDAPGLTTLQLLTPLRDQLQAAGFRMLFECQTNGCGGFDFRFDIAVMPEPDMHVDLGDFRYLAARDNAGTSISVLVSRSATAGYLQLTRIEPNAPAKSATLPGVAAFAPTVRSPAPQTGLATLPPPDLLTGGALVLDGLQFDSGSSDLTQGRYPSLATLADWLRANPDKTVALVGHTDASGGLDANIALSRRRAQSVRQRLIDSYGIPATQIEAQGVGYLSPRATNLTTEGRDLNRRVEAILTSTQ